MKERARILFVDDERKFADAMAKVLRYGGFTVQTAYSGSDALNHFQNDIFDLVITDLKMPVMDGIELIRRIRNIKQEQKILVITAFPGQVMPWNRRFTEFGEQELDLDALSYLVKPFTPKHLIEIVEESFMNKPQTGAPPDIESVNKILKPEERELLKHEETVVTKAVPLISADPCLPVLEDASAAIGSPSVCVLVDFNGGVIAEVNDLGLGKDAYSGRFSLAMTLLRETLIEVSGESLSEGILKLGKHWVVVRFMERTSMYLCIITSSDVPMGTLRTVARKTTESLLH